LEISPYIVNLFYEISYCMFIERDILKRIVAHLNKDEITVITGPRQVGKTTILQRLMKKAEQQGINYFYLNYDIEEDRRHLTTQRSLLNKIKLECGEKRAFIFIDEIQRKEDAGLFLKGLFDMQTPYKFIVTGSGSLELKEKISESLTGRKRVFNVKPLSFVEFINYRTGGKYSDRLKFLFSVEPELAEELLEEYITFGGYPKVVLSDSLQEKHEVIKEIFTSTTEKDLFFFLKLNRPEAMNHMLRILALTAGKPVNYTWLSKETGLSVPTVKNYLYYLEKIFMIFPVYPFFKNRIKEISKSPVLYFNDMGLCNYLTGQFKSGSPVLSGFRFQHFAWRMLSDRYEETLCSLNYWRTTDKAEVDFVINCTDKVIPWEVKYTNLKRKEVTRSMYSFIEKYDPPEAYILNRSLSVTSHWKNTVIKHLTVGDAFM
jgi:predicted AAA+ superfamily ATPase